MMALTLIHAPQSIDRDSLPESSFFQSIGIKHGQTVHVSWQKHGHIVRVLCESFNSIFKKSLTVISQWREKLVVIKGLRTLTCYKCAKENFYIEIETSIQSEFLSLLDGKFVCPKCKEKMK